MNVEPIIFFDMLLAILILSIALVVVKKHNPPVNLTDEEPQKSIRIIDDANSKALDIVNKANLVSNTLTNDFNEQIKRVAASKLKEFEKSSSDFTKLYNQILQDLKSKNIEVFQNISKDIELNTMQEIKNFRESMEKLTASSESLVKKKIDSDYKAAKTELENYKKDQFKKIDDEIYALLEKVSKMTLGKAINLTGHEELIEKSLEKAKKEGVFE